MTDPKDHAMAPGVLVLGAAGSGKSAYAEQLCVGSARTLRAGSLYLATMPSGGEDARRRIERHRKLREGKGFETLELPQLLLLGLCPIARKNPSMLMSNFSSLASPLWRTR